MAFTQKTQQRFMAAIAVFLGHVPARMWALTPFVDTALSTTGGSLQDTKWPLLIPLTKEVVPVVRDNVTVSYKTSFSGPMSIGFPAQEFQVVFDTGSAHIVVPASTCPNQTCKEHRQYNIEASKGAVAINVDGDPVPADELCDQVTIGYGTGMVTGEFVREKVCLGSMKGQTREPCIDVSIVMAVEMSPQPFESFNFDGIFGLALDSLAMTPEFSFFNSLAGAKTSASLQFGVFLTDGEHELQSEIALGGHNADRLLTPLQWAPVAMKELGYWQVFIKEVRIDNKTLPLCQNGTCRGIVDTGTSHLGIPEHALEDVFDLLSVESHDLPEDCRQVVGVNLEIVLDNDLVLTLPPANYMRPLSAPMITEEEEASAANQTGVSVVTSSAETTPFVNQTSDLRACVPKVMPVDFPAPLGPDLFILGEPVLHRYYTVYDWAEKKIGFGVSTANAHVNVKEKSRFLDDHTVLLQVTVKVAVRARRDPKRPVAC